MPVSSIRTMAVPCPGSARTLDPDLVFLGLPLGDRLGGVQQQVHEQLLDALLIAAHVDVGLERGTRRARCLIWFSVSASAVCSGSRSETVARRSAWWPGDTIWTSLTSRRNPFGALKRVGDDSERSRIVWSLDAGSRSASVCRFAMT